MQMKFHVFKFGCLASVCVLFMVLVTLVFLPPSDRSEEVAECISTELGLDLTNLMTVASFPGREAVYVYRYTGAFDATNVVYSDAGECRTINVAEWLALVPYTFNDKFSWKDMRAYFNRQNIREIRRETHTVYVVLGEDQLVYYFEAF